MRVILRIYADLRATKSVVLDYHGTGARRILSSTCLNSNQVYGFNIHCSCCRGLRADTCHFVIRVGVSESGSMSQSLGKLSNRTLLLLCHVRCTTNICYPWCRQDVYVLTSSFTDIYHKRAKATMPSYYPSSHHSAGTSMRHDTSQPARTF